MQKDLLTDLLHLVHSFGAANQTLKRLLDCFEQDPRQLRRASTAALRASGCNQATIEKIRCHDDAAVRRDLAWADQPGHHLISHTDREYPASLNHIEDRPALLYASGNPGLLKTPQVAIVGARHCTPGGAENARELASSLSAVGLTITSGLALGIDSAAHHGALQTRGDTIAVIGTGIDQVYPPVNRKLMTTIERGGLVVSELALGARARRHHFPLRNRIISGLSLATVVVEASDRSGSLITARLAAEQGREVFALPGSIHNPLARGCHRLLRNGAILAEGAQDILAELLPALQLEQDKPGAERKSPAKQIDGKHRQLLEAIGYDPVTTDTIVQRSGLTIDQVSSMLLLLELNDYIQSVPGGCFVRI